MFNRIKNWLFKPKSEVKPVKRIGIFSTDSDLLDIPTDDVYTKAINRTFQKDAAEHRVQMAGVAMDDSIQDIKLALSQNFTGIPSTQMDWYGSQGFIGHQLCSMLAQHWLIAKACQMPADDAIRNGYELAVNDGSDINPEVISEIRKYDVKYRLNAHLAQFVNFGRVFGIRIAMFKVDSDDPNYYEKPFNIDGVKPGSYKGIVQIDPYWVTPELDGQAASDPSSLYFYEPTWWRVNGKRYHRTHLIIMRNGEVADILKPTYLYGGIPIPQKIYERVYAAERTANEAPQLALTKRSNVLKLDVAQYLAQQTSTEQRIQRWAYLRDNYGVKIVGLDEEVQQFDTSLTDLDAVIMTQYQIVAAAANVPATKLLGTTPKGFNSTGEYEEANYHEELESIQTHALTPLLDRHHILLMKSVIMPKFKMKEAFDITVAWNPTDAVTNKEVAELNKLKAETDQQLVMIGAIDGQDVRNRITIDKDSGYNGIEDIEERSDDVVDPIDTDPIDNPESEGNEPFSGPKTDKTPGLVTQGG